MTTASLTTLALASALAIPVALPAQVMDTDPIPEHFAEKTFTLPVNEFYRLWLEGGHRYRVELAGEGLTFTLDPIDEANEPVLIQPLLLGESASHTRVYTVTVRDSGLYSLRATGGRGGRAVTVHISEAPAVRDSTSSSTGRPARHR